MSESLRRVASVVTPLGWFVAALVAVACLLIAVGGWVEAIVVAVAGGVSLLLAVLSLLGRGTFHVDVRLPQGRTRIGDTAFGDITVTQTGTRRSRPSVVELPIGLGVLPLVIPSLKPGEAFTESFGIPATRRGVVVLGPARSVRSDALGLVSTAKEWNESVELYVHPATVHVPFDAVGFHNDAEGVVTSRLSSSDVSFHAMRDYAPGDDPRHIHWPTTARTGRLSVRHYEETRRSHHLIVLDAATDSWPDDAFELGVSITASMALAGLRLNRPVDVVTSQGNVPSSAPVALLDALTKLQTDRSLVAFDDVVRRAVNLLPSISALTVVCGPATEDSAMLAWTRVPGLDVVTSIVRVAPLRPATRRSIGGAALIDCPTLAELPRLVQERP